MNWSTNKSILLSRICVAIFALLLAALDFGAYWLVTWYIHLRGMAWHSGAGMIVTLYLCSIFGWVLLWQMWTLLNNIRRSEVFIPENIRCLRIVSWCCVAAGAICLVSTLFYIPFAAKPVHSQEQQGQGHPLLNADGAVPRAAMSARGYFGVH